MTIQEFASRLNGREIGDEISEAEEAEAKRHGFIVAFGYSDDNLELRGACNDEVGAYDGTKVTIAANGEPISNDDDEVPFRQLIKDGWTPPPSLKPVLDITAEWSPKNLDASWLITSNAAFAPFDIMEDGGLFCRGAVIDFKAASNL